MYLNLATDPPEVSAAERAVYSGPRGKADLTCIVKAEPRANVSEDEDIIFVNINMYANFNLSVFNIKIHQIANNNPYYFRLLGILRDGQLN